MRGIQPGNASAPAEAGDQQTMGIAAVACGPAGDVVEVGQHLRIRHFADQLLEQGGDIGVVIRIALAEVELWRDSQIPSCARRRQMSRICSCTPKIS
jgi:hypothetical protein